VRPTCFSLDSRQLLGESARRGAERMQVYLVNVLMLCGKGLVRWMFPACVCVISCEMASSEVAEDSGFYIICERR
jgi:hypothetical protein